MPRRNTKAATKLKKKEAMIKQRRAKELGNLPEPDPQSSDSDSDTSGSDVEAPINTVKMSRNYHDHYQNILKVCAAFRIFASRSITVQESARAQSFLSSAFQAWATLNTHLTPNFHLAMHMEEFIASLGPIYVFWVFPFERFMGTLSKFKTNGHTGGELESTLMRAWWKTQRCHDLVCAMLHGYTSQ